LPDVAGDVHGRHRVWSVREDLLVKELPTGSLQTSVWWNPFTVEHLVLRTALSPDECLRRLRASIPTFWRGPTRRTAFAGRANGHRFALRNNSAGYRNDFRPFAFGKIADDMAGGATIDLRLRLPNALRVWLTIAILAVPFMLLLAGISAEHLAARGVSGQTLFAVLLPLALCLGYPLYLGGFWAARGDRVYLVGRLQALLEASDPFTGLSYNELERQSQA